MSEVLTFGGMRPGSAYIILPGQKQLWWKPCLTRASEGGDTHCWFIAPTNDGSLYCHVCRVGKPLVCIGPREHIAEIRAALEAGDIGRAQAMAFGDAKPLPPAAPALPWRPAYRDRSDWLEWWTERAAICEHLGGMTREEAERAADELAGTWPQ